MRLLIVAGDRALGVEAGRIVAPDGRFDQVLEFPKAELRPGLINAHDHLHRNHYGRLGSGPYDNAYDWAVDIQSRYRRRIGRGRSRPRREALLAGAWKNLFAGVTRVVHHDPWEEEFERDFPIRVLRIRSADSLGMSSDLDALEGDGVQSLHLAEGVDRNAAEEVRWLADRGLLSPRLIAVHGVGVDPDGSASLARSGAALAWCPSSNIFLFGRTAPDHLLNGDIDVLLGSDSLLTGAGDLLDELRCARALGLVDDERLEQAVGTLAARRLGSEPPSLAPGSPADLVVLARPLLEASARDVLLVMVGGVPRVAALDLVPRLGAWLAAGRTLRLGAVSRWVNATSSVARGDGGDGPNG